MRYVVKGDPPGRLIRASEWLCTHLAEAAGLVGPPTAVIEMPSGDLAFGSRKLPGIAVQAETINYLLQAQAAGPVAVLPPAPDLSKHLSEIYAFDMAVHNEDRHLNNYLMVREANVPRLYCFDYSRSLFWAWPLQGFPPPPSRTRSVGALLRQVHGFDLAAASALIARLGAINDATLQALLNQMPEAWLPAAKRAELEDWWLDGRVQRLQVLEQGLANGTLL